MANKRSDDGFDLGDHAEGQFDLWCREVGVVATPPRKDKGGWDYHVVLPGGGTTNLLTSPPLLNCSVQVKGQWDGSEQTPKIKLSNWERMISEPIPWFICIVLYSPARQPIRCALVHVDKEWVSKAAKRIWKNAASKKEPLCDLTMRVTWDDTQTLPSLSGAALLARIRAHVGDAEHYVRQKIDWRRNAGIEGPRHLIRVKMNEPDDDVYYRRLAELAVGEIDELNVSEISASEVRFGIPLPKDDFKDAVIKLQKRATSGKTKIKFTATTPVRESFEVEFDTTSATRIFPFLPVEYRRVRFNAPLLQLDMRADGPSATQFEWNFSVELGTRVRLSDLVQAGRVIGALLDPSAPDPTFTLPDGTAVANPSKILPHPRPSEETLALVEIAQNAGIVARAFDLAPADVLVVPGDLMGERKGLAVFAGVFSGTTPQLSFAVEEADMALDGKNIAYVVVPGVRIGTRLLLLALAVTGNATWQGRDVVVTRPAIRVLERHVLPMEKAKKRGFFKKFVRPTLKRGRKRLSSEGFVVVQVREDPR